MNISIYLIKLYKEIKKNIDNIFSLFFEYYFLEKKCIGIRNIPNYNS